MKEHLFLSLLFSLMFVLATLCQTTFADMPPAHSEDICRYFSNNTVIRDPDSCNKKITCINFVSHYEECPKTKPLFDKDKGSCVATLPDDSVCHIDCIDSIGKFVPDPKSCKSYYYCHDEEFATPGKCPDSTHFHVEKQSCIFKHESECAIEQFDFCALVKNGVNFRDEKFCHQYYVCTNGKQVSKTCSKKYYQPSKGSCADKATVDCPEHPLPENVCGKKGTNYFVEDGATCYGYFLCTAKDDPNPRWGQCPTDRFFSSSKQACVHPLEVKCAWDRCDGRTLTFVTSGKKGCRHYLRCRDGLTAQELNCGNKFFDERSGICTSEIILETACKS